MDEKRKRATAPPKHEKCHGKGKRALPAHLELKKANSD